MSKKPGLVEAAALAGILTLAGCATGDHTTTSRTDSQGGAPLTVTQENGGPVIIERTPGPEGGLSIPRQVIVPEVKKPEPKDKKNSAGTGGQALEVEPQAGGTVIVSREPDPKTGGLRIPRQAVVPTVSPAKQDKADGQIHEPPGHEP